VTNDSRNLRKDDNQTARLRVQQISTFFGQAQALENVSLSVHEGECVAILGSNGAGKSTLIRTITGLLAPKEGEILFEGKQITSKRPHEVVAMGIATVLEGRDLFGILTVKDNLTLGVYPLPREEKKRMLKERIEMVFSLFPILKQRLKQKAGMLSGGEQRMLAVGRALMANPRLLVLDEPSLGLSPLLTTELMRLLKFVCNEWRISILLVEQNARAALKVADYVYLLERGRVVFEGACEDVVSNPAIHKAYLGG